MSHLKLLAYAIVVTLEMPLANTQAQQVPIPTTAAAVPGPAPGTAMTNAYVQTVGRMAYLWGWSLVNVANRAAAFAKAPEPGLLGGVVPVAFNRIAMLTGYISPEEHFVTCPNQDVVYGFAYADLDQEPLVFQVPDFGDRFWVYALYDARTDEFGKVGKQYGTKPGFYLMVGPNWKGETPAGITAVVRSSTSVVTMGPRIFMDDTAEDQKAIQPVINQIDFYPLSEFDGKMKITEWSKLPHFPAPESKGKGETEWVNPETFFDQLPTVMKSVPPLPGEEALYKWIGSVLDAADRNPEIKKTLTETAVASERELIDPFFQWRYNGRPAGNGWNSPVNNAEWGTDYLNRTGTAKSNMYDNRPEETKYIYTDNDNEDKQLNGQNSYSITFAKGQVPPVKGFWSLTLYNDLHLFHPNALKRYSLGTKNKDLQFDSDGSLTLYVGAKSPGKDKENNWLPAPNGPFSLYLRAYWAERAILDGQWKPPVVTKVQQAQTNRFEELGNMPFANDYPTEETAQRLKDELLFERGVQSYLWALPAINMWGMKQGSEGRFGVGYNVLPVWKERLNAKTLVTTPNSDVIYAMGYVDLGKDGPLVIEVPPKLQGILDDFWQRPVVGPTIDGHTFAGDVGFAGPDKGEGGKYLLLPPGYQGTVPAAGYFVYRPLTNNVFVFWRAFFSDPTQLAEPVELIERTRIYPLGKEDSAKAMQFPDASNVPVNMLFPSDESYFQMLSRFIDSEVVEPADLGWRGMLAGIGIVKGQPFEPDERTKAILDNAAKTAFKTTKVLAFDVFPAKADARIYKDRQWTTPILGAYGKDGADFDLEFLWRSGTFRDLDARINFFTNYYSLSPGMLSKVPGKGAAYLVGFKDSEGRLYSGDKSYRVQLPAGVPAANFWSLTLYDALTASGLDNGRPFPSLGSRDQPAANADGSFDLYLSPTAPPGKEKNWLRTVPGKGYFVILRLYGPTKPFLNQTWRPGDMEEMK